MGEAGWPLQLPTPESLSQVSAAQEQWESGSQPTVTGPRGKDRSSGAYLHQVRLHIKSVALVHTQVLMEMPVPNMAKRLIFSTSRLGRFLISQSGIGLLVWVAIVTLASHLHEKHGHHVVQTMCQALGARDPLETGSKPAPRGQLLSLLRGTGEQLLLGLRLRNTGTACPTLAPTPAQMPQ